MGRIPKNIQITGLIPQRRSHVLKMDVISITIIYEIIWQLIYYLPDFKTLQWKIFYNFQCYASYLQQLPPLVHCHPALKRQKLRFISVKENTVKSITIIRIAGDLATVLRPFIKLLWIVRKNQAEKYAALKISIWSSKFKIFKLQ